MRGRRRKEVSFLLMPIAIFLWCIGWSLRWIGVKRESKISKVNLQVQNELEIFVETPEQKYATLRRRDS